MSVSASRYRRIHLGVSSPAGILTANSDLPPMVAQYFSATHFGLFVGCLRRAQRVNRHHSSESSLLNVSLATTGWWYCAQPRRIGFSSRMSSACFTIRLDITTPFTLL